MRVSRIHPGLVVRHHRAIVTLSNQSRLERPSSNILASNNAHFRTALGIIQLQQDIPCTAQRSQYSPKAEDHESNEQDYQANTPHTHIVDIETGSLGQGQGHSGILNHRTVRCHINQPPQRRREPQRQALGEPP